MKTSVSVRNNVAILEVAGEFNADTAFRFQEAVEQARQEDPRDFVIDLHGITSIDSAGLQALSDLHREVEERLGMVRFYGADTKMRKILEITRLSNRFAIDASLEESLAGLS